MAVVLVVVVVIVEVVIVVVVIVNQFCCPVKLVVVGSCSHFSNYASVIAMEFLQLVWFSLWLLISCLQLTWMSSLASVLLMLFLLMMLLQQIIVLTCFLVE